MARACAESYVRSRRDREFNLLPPEAAARACGAFDRHIEEGTNAASLAAARAVAELEIPDAA
jgi:hypothetical protein